MHIYQILGAKGNGGAELMFERFCIALEQLSPKTGVTQKIFIRHNSERIERMHALQDKIELLPFGGFFDIATKRKIYANSKIDHPDLLFSWMNRASRKTPKTHIPHIARLGGYYDLKYYKNTDYLIANTEDLKDYLLKKGWPEARVSMISNFVSEQRGGKIDREKYTTPADTPLIFACGRLHENKGFDILLKALPHVKNAWLWLAGDGPLRDQLQKLAHDLGIADRVRFLGWVDNTADYFATADYFCIPSRHEPLGNVVLESFYQQRPVIAIASQGPTQLITHECEGLLSPIDDHFALSASLNQALDDPNLCQNMVQMGHQKYQKYYSQQVIVDQYLNCFKKVIKMGKRFLPQEH